MSRRRRKKLRLKQMTPSSGKLNKMQKLGRLRSAAGAYAFGSDDVAFRILKDLVDNLKRTGDW